jgi:isopentenyl-diphosphate delta-isomerase
MRENCLSVNTLASTSYVALRTPLPCITGAHGAGFVHAIAKDRFLIRFANNNSSKTLSDKAEVLTITTEQGTHFTFSASITGGELDQDGMSEARVPDTRGSDQVSDLLALLRKSQHINICNNDDVEAKDKYTGFSDVFLMPCALPDFDADDVVTKTTFLGRNFDLPLLITGMTGGLEQGAEINLRLAKAAARFNIPMGVGSQRIALENRNYEKIFAVKEVVPSVFLIGNIGMAQLKEKNPVDACQRAVDMIGADALAIHLNVLQELIQVEGDRHFRGITNVIAEIAAKISVPLIIKEVGCGIDQESAKTLLSAGVAAIDCGGKGGTSWGYIEGLRAQSNITKNLGSTFRDWGIPTAIATAILHRSYPQATLIATGGIRDGITAASAIGLGATMCGIGLPLLRAAIKSAEDVVDTLDELASGLRIAMVASGAKTTFDLRSKVRMNAAFREQISQYGQCPDLN